MEQSSIIRIHPEYKEEKPLPPAQFNLFTGEPETVRVEVDTEPEEGREVRVADGISMIKTGDASSVILSGYGLYLGKKSERLVVRSNKKVIYEFPLMRLNEVTVTSRGISISTDLIEVLCERGIRVSFLSGGGKPYAMLTSPMLNATVITRREQLTAYNDQRSLEFSKSIVMGKIRNQERLLRYFGKYLKRTDYDRFEKVNSTADSLKGLKRKPLKLKGASIAETRGSLLGLEGTAGRLYWDGVKEIVSARTEFMGRQRRGAVDEVNSLLNYGYGILYSQVWGAVLNAGLEPFAGFLHVDRPGKPSLVLDLVEEFRQPVVDRVVIAHVNLGENIAMMADGMLDAETRKSIGAKVLERLESTESVRGKQYQVRSIIQMQARMLAKFLKDGGQYRPFTFKW